MIKMYDVTFEWDENKDRLNFLKHGVSFNEALTVFFDDNALLIVDKDHSEHEERFVILGLSKGLRLLVVCHCYRISDSVIRLISARKASKHERDQYGGAL